MFEYDTEIENLQHSREVALEEYIALCNHPDWQKHQAEAAEALAKVQEFDRLISDLEWAEEELAKDAILERQELEDFEGLSYRDDEVAGDYGGDF